MKQPKKISKKNYIFDQEPKLDEDYVDAAEVAQKVISVRRKTEKKKKFENFQFDIQGVFPGVKTTELDNLAAETAAYLSTQHPDYAKLGNCLLQCAKTFTPFSMQTTAARIAVSNLQKETVEKFSDVIEIVRKSKKKT